MRNIILALVMAAASVFAACGSASATLTADANHSLINIDFLYHGSTVSVRGEADSGVDLVVKITSPEAHQALKTKGKVGGVLWMNVGQLEFEHLPGYYALYATRDINRILDASEREKYGIGYDVLGRKAEIRPLANEEDRAKWFSEFIKFKEGSNLYAAPKNIVTTTGKDSASASYFMKSDWPFQAPPGIYDVTVYAVKNGRVAEEAHSKVTVEQVGIVKTLSDMAKNNAAAYGGISIAAALLAGFGVGLIYRKDGGAH